MGYDITNPLNKLRVLKIEKNQMGLELYKAKLFAKK